MMNLGESIKQARENLGMSQKTLAGLLGVQTQTVWRWEKGEREPSWEIIQNIANLLNAPQITDTVHELDQSRKTIPLGLGYWGSVVDNAREIAKQGNINDIVLIETLLKSACEILAQVKDSVRTNDANAHYIDIRQNNIGRDATVNFGATPAEITA